MKKYTSLYIYQEPERNLNICEQTKAIRKERLVVHRGTFSDHGQLNMAGYRS
jgi:hypothetical protein